MRQHSLLKYKTANVTDYVFICYLYMLDSRDTVIKLLTARFYQPDSDMPVTFLVNPDNAPVNDGGMSEVNNAINAWNGAGSRLHLVNGGSTTAFGF